MKCNIKHDPAKLPEPKLPPTKAVDIGRDKMSYIPVIEEPPKNKQKGWSAKDERILVKLKSAGLRDKEIARKMGRTLDSIKWKIKTLRKKGAL